MLPAAPSRVTRLASLALASLLVLGYGYLGTSRILGDAGGDSAVYWLTANHYSPYAAAQPGAAQVASTSKYPPAYPALLAVLGGGNDLRMAHLITVGCLLSAFWQLWRWARESGVGEGQATMLVATFASLGITRIEALQLHSEHLLLPVALAAMRVAVPLRRTPRIGAALVLGVLVAVAILTRTAAITLLAMLACMAVRERSAAWLAACASAALGIAATALGQAGAPGYVAEAVAAYQREGVLAMAWGVMSNLPVAWTMCLLDAPLTYRNVSLCGLAGLWCLWGSLRRARAGEPDGYYALFGLALLALWPYPVEQPRLIFVLLPILLLHGLWLGLAIVENRAPAWRRVAALAGAVPLLVGLVGSLKFAGNFALPLPAPLEPYRWHVQWHIAQLKQPLAQIYRVEAWERAFAQLRDQLPPEACVYAVKPALVGFFGQRVGKTPPPPGLEAGDFARAVRDGGCNAFLLSSATSPSFPTPFYPYERLDAAWSVVSSTAALDAPDRPSSLLVVRSSTR